MGHKDFWIRYAARIVVEAQPVELWEKHVICTPREITDWLQLNAALALARCGNPKSEDQFQRIMEIAMKNGYEDLVRVMHVALARYDVPAVSVGVQRDFKAELRRITPQSTFSGRTDALGRQLAEIAVAVEAPEAPAKIIQLMREAKAKPGLSVDSNLLTRNGKYGSDVSASLAPTTTTVRIGLAVYLARAKAGWTPELRREFFVMLDEMSQARGGHSLRGFVANIRKAALENVPEGERALYAEIKAPSAQQARPVAKGPGRTWTEETALAAWRDAKVFDFENGRRMFEAAACSMCHRVGDLGGAQAPDLTGVGSRMTPADLIQSIVNPSAVVSDQYAQSVITRVNGTKVVGRVLAEVGDAVQVSINPFEATQPLVINRSSIDTIERSPVSPMPEGLANTLSAKELTDLLAYLQAGGRKDDPLYRKSR